MSTKEPKEKPKAVKESKVIKEHKEKAQESLEKWKDKYSTKIEKKGRDMTISAKAQKKLNAKIVTVENGIDNALLDIANRKKKKEIKEVLPSDKNVPLKLNSNNIFGCLEEE